MASQTASHARTLASGAQSPHAASRDSQTLILPDGRTLGFAEYGPASGKPLFFFHGCPSARIEAALLEEKATKAGARIISPDRPGMGISSFQPNRALTDWPSDVQHLAQHLKLDVYRVLGGSGGGPYAVACAKMLPKASLKAVGILAGAGPWEAGLRGQNPTSKLTMYLAAYWPSALRYLSRKMIVEPQQRKSDEELLKDMDKFVARLSEKDRAAFEKEPEAKMALVQVMKESFKQGLDGYIQEGVILTRPWGFKLEDIDFGKVLLWYGTEDSNTPLAWGKYMADRIPNAILKEYPGETHFTLDTQIDEVLQELMAV
ncbi:hypothetical protein FH972_025973 [Carpinus fangiana]|uniref:AB hydrolase-1 domain-containing protein n=1 Tax=Carpinus fangiana TaxID=176857 RepID=A0A5N6L2K5_9ROSI|nr:hypothetical protein FH972_025973 [Carpinus fangiana]